MTRRHAPSLAKPTVAKVLAENSLVYKRKVARSFGELERVRLQVAAAPHVVVGAKETLPFTERACNLAPLFLQRNEACRLLFSCFNIFLVLWDVLPTADTCYYYYYYDDS